MPQSGAFPGRSDLYWGCIGSCQYRILRSPRAAAAAAAWGAEAEGWETGRSGERNTKAAATSAASAPSASSALRPVRRFARLSDSGTLFSLMAVSIGSAQQLFAREGFECREGL